MEVLKFFKWALAEGQDLAKELDYVPMPAATIPLIEATWKDIKGVGDMPNQHDILTGSQADGRAIPGDKDMTCGNWTSSGEGAAMVGHHDRIGLRDDDASKSWNASHPSRGCSQDALRSSGGDYAVRLKGGTELSVSRSRREELEERIGMHR